MQQNEGQVQTSQTRVTNNNNTITNKIQRMTQIFKYLHQQDGARQSNLYTSSANASFQS